MENIRVKDLTFEPFLPAQQLRRRVGEMGAQLRADYSGRQPYYLIMLKGAFIFAADLIRAVGLPGEINFVRLASYTGLSTTRQVRTLLPPNPEEIRGKDIIIIEDIVDSGHTLREFLPLLQTMQPASVAVAVLLFKPDALECDVPVDYVGFEIPTHFVVGYGLDYDGHGRELEGVWRLAGSEEGGERT